MRKNTGKNCQNKLIQYFIEINQRLATIQGAFITSYSKINS